MVAKVSKACLISNKSSSLLQHPSCENVKSIADDRYVDKQEKKREAPDGDLKTQL